MIVFGIILRAETRNTKIDLPYLTLLCDKFEKVNVPPKLYLFFLTLFWGFVMFFQLKTSFKVYAPKYKTSSNCHIIGLDTVGLVFLVSD
jgi:hypothetical protein